MPCLNKRLHPKIDNRIYLILSSNLKTDLFTYILYMKQSSGFVELHNGPHWSKKFVPLRILIRFGRSLESLLTLLCGGMTTTIYGSSPCRERTTRLYAPWKPQPGVLSQSCIGKVPPLKLTVITSAADLVRGQYYSSHILCHNDESYILKQYDLNNIRYTK